MLNSFSCVHTVQTCFSMVCLMHVQRGLSWLHSCLQFMPQPLSEPQLPFQARGQSRGKQRMGFILAKMGGSNDVVTASSLPYVLKLDFPGSEMGLILICLYCFQSDQAFSERGIPILGSQSVTLASFSPQKPGGRMTLKDLLSSLTNE